MATPSDGKGKGRALEASSDSQTNSGDDDTFSSEDEAALEERKNQLEDEMGQLVGDPNEERRKRYIYQRFGSLVEAQKRARNDSRLLPHIYKRACADAKIYSMFLRRVQNRRMFAGMIGPNNSLAVHPQRFMLQYPWGNQVMKHGASVEFRSARESDTVRERLYSTVNVALDGKIPSAWTESVKFACQEMYEELGDNYPADTDKHPEIVRFGEATSGGLVVHGCQNGNCVGNTSMVSAFMHQRLQMHDQVGNPSDIVLVYSFPIFSDSHDTPKPNHRIAIMKSLCLQLLCCTGSSSLESVTELWPRSAEQQGNNFHALCRLFRNLILGTAGSTTSVRKVTVLVDGLQVMDPYERRLLDVLNLFRTLCAELEYTGLINNLHFKYVLLHPGISIAAAHPHPIEFHAFLDNQLGQTRIDELEKLVVSIHSKKFSQVPQKQSMPSSTYGLPHLQPQNAAGLQAYPQSQGGRFDYPGAPAGPYYSQVWPQPLPGTMPQQQIFAPPAYGLQSHQPQNLGGALQIDPYAWQAPTAYTAGMQPPPPYFIPQYPSGGQQGGGQGGFGQGQHFNQRSSRGSGVNQRGQK